MKIELASAHHILVELNREDLAQFRLTVDQLDGAPQRAGLLLRQVLLAAAGTTGCVYRLQPHAQVDVLPDKTGGCLLIVSGCDSVPASRTVVCYWTDDVNALVDLARAAAKTGQTRVTLLQTDAGFLLLPQESGAPDRLFAEFLRPRALSKAALWLLQEHSVVLLSNESLSTLGGS